MPKKIKTKDRDTFSRNEIINNKPTHIKFNLSFMTTNNDFCYDNDEFTDEHKLSLMKRMMDLSKENFTTIFTYPKNIGIEMIPKSNLKEVSFNPRFSDAEFRKKEIDGKYAVFRLYQNNNPLPSRIIGKLINNVFYILYIDLKHQMYKG